MLHKPGVLGRCAAQTLALLEHGLQAQPTAQTAPGADEAYLRHRWNGPCMKRSVGEGSTSVMSWKARTARLA